MAERPPPSQNVQQELAAWILQNISKHRT
jgi:hypothetical protein